MGVNARQRAILGQIFGADVPSQVLEEVSLRNDLLDASMEPGGIGIIALIDAIRFCGFSAPVREVARSNELDVANTPLGAKVWARFHREWEPCVYRGAAYNGGYLVDRGLGYNEDVGKSHLRLTDPNAVEELVAVEEPEPEVVITPTLKSRIADFDVDWSEVKKNEPILMEEGENTLEGKFVRYMGEGIAVVHISGEPEPRTVRHKTLTLVV